ncbi:glycerophosphodiester phosphodiesterase [Solibacillus sp. CAU 1738]|uniref:glycerophosphodiester phosphodiesterase n=1 Tax=Solibacillus sp. CAU 1738 TaxID=3140363 RepID=UPI003260713B
MKLFAHRGVSKHYPENTLASFRAAVKLPIEGVELDVHMTSDGEVVVIHDEKINRTSNGKGFVKDKTLAELRTYDFGSWFHKKFRGEKIPTLREVLEIFKHTNHLINIELKSDVFVYAGLEEAVLREVTAMGMQPRIIISSFDHAAIVRMKKLAPIACAVLFSNIILQPNEYRKALGIEALHVSKYVAKRKPIREAIEQGAVVRAYTVNNKEEAQQLANVGVEAIFTDDPELFL